MADNSDFVETSALLWDGELPGRAEADFVAVDAHVAGPAVDVGDNRQRAVARADKVQGILSPYQVEFCILERHLFEVARHNLNERVETLFAI